MEWFLYDNGLRHERVDNNRLILLLNYLIPRKQLVKDLSLVRKGKKMSLVRSS